MSQVYFVVQFVNEGSIAIVSSIWLSGDGSTSYWAPYTNKQSQNAARRCEVPEENWKTYSIKEWARCGKYF